MSSSTSTTPTPNQTLPNNQNSEEQIAMDTSSAPNLTSPSDIVNANNISTSSNQSKSAATTASQSAEAMAPVSCLLLLLLT